MEINHVTIGNTKIEVSSLIPVVSEIGEWWRDHVKYWQFTRQGIDIVCAKFEHSPLTNVKPIANVIIVTGWGDTFLKYAEITKYLYENRFNVHMYDHQSQGLSGRWLPDTQLVWINSFDDYIDDFIHFVNMISKDDKSTSFNLPLYVLGYCMGGLVASATMARLPSLISRTILISPMFRNKCGIQRWNYSFILPQPIVRWCAYLAAWAGLGSSRCLGFSREQPETALPLNVFTSDEKQLLMQQALRCRHPQIIANSITNDWLNETIIAQRKFAHRFDFIRTNTMIICAEHDVFVYTRAMAMFLRKSINSVMFTCKGAYHDLLHERDEIRHPLKHLILAYFKQSSDSVHLIEAPRSANIVKYDKSTPVYSIAELVLRGVGLVLAGVGAAVGTALMIDVRRRSSR